MRNVTPKHLALRLLIVLATLATLLSVSAPSADANVFDCPGVHNVDLSTSDIGSAILIDLEWDVPTSYYRAALFCPDIIGLDVRDGNDETIVRYEWTALELVFWAEKYPLMATHLPRFQRGWDVCEWSVTLYTRAPGAQNIGTVKYSKTEHGDRWGAVRCLRLSDIVSPIPRISYAPVVSEDPPSIEP